MSRLARGLAAAVLAAAAPAAGAAGRYVDLEARYWAPDVTGAVEVRERGFGTLIDLEDDLGIGDDELPEARLLWHPTRRLFVRLAYLPIDLGGDRVVSRTLSFGGTDFEVSTRVLSDLQVDYGRAAVGWQLISTDSGALRLGPMVGVAAFRGEAALAAPELPVPLAERREFELALASAGAMLDLELTDAFHLFAEASLLVGADEGDLLDAEVGIRYFFFGRLAGVAGWRTITIDAEEGDDVLDVDLQGLFVGLTLRF